MPLIIGLYAVLAATVVFLSIRLAHYVDLIDKKSNLSGAFIGGVILAAVTSLPELFTSISAVTIVNQPKMVIGNILGSNIFNMFVLGIIVLFAAKGFNRSVVGKSHVQTSVFTLVLFLLMALPVYFKKDLTRFNISIYSVIIIALYVLSIRFMAGDTASEEGESDSPLTLKQIAVRFSILAVLLVSASVGITYVTDMLESKLSLGATYAGAVFLGVATSLPELTSSIALVRKGNFNACVGNVIGSGIFNFCILAVADLIYRKGSVYSSDTQSRLLVVLGSISTLLVIITLSIKSKNENGHKKLAVLYGFLGVGIIFCYALFLILSQLMS
ncbi:MAG: cation transporter [Oscillospiraceae bacterium]|jgi:cation:H+ antiporter